MKTRHLSPVGVVVVSIVALTGCTASTPSPGFDRAEAAQEYVELLRGANDLAHGSLDVPSSSTLPAFAAVSSALRHAGEPPREVSREALEELTRRSGEDAAWSAFYLCEATGGDTDLVTQIVPKITWSTPTIGSVNGAADRIVVESARHCLGLPDLLDEADWTALAQHASGNALVSVQLAELARRLGHPEPAGLVSSADLASIDEAVQADGCSDWVLANSAAARSLVEASTAVMPERVAACASNDQVDITEPTTLLYLTAADVPAVQVASLLDANSDVVDGALSLDRSIATPGTTATGNGTLSSSRDAVLYLRLRGSSPAPDWLGEGVLSAIDGALSEGDTIDALYLCAALELECPASFVSRARAVTLDVVDTSLTKHVNGAARAVEAALEAGLEVPAACTRDRVNAWLAEEPQLLAALAAGEKECVELLDLDDAALAPLVRGALDDLRPEDALAYCLLRLLARDAGPDSGTLPDASSFSSTARDGFAALWSRVDAENGDGYLASVRPLRIELAQAKEDQWLD